MTIFRTRCNEPAALWIAVQEWMQINREMARFYKNLTVQPGAMPEIQLPAGFVLGIGGKLTIEQ
jgi:hypothetical protein